MKLGQAELVRATLYCLAGLNRIWPVMCVEVDQAVQWEALRQQVNDNDVPTFLHELCTQLQGGTNHFKILQRGLQAYCFTQVCMHTT